MQHRRGRRHEDARNAQTDERAVEADHEAVVCVDAAHEVLRDAAQRDQLEQAFRRDGDVRDLARDGSAVADGDADVRRRQRRRVVDAVADHDDRAAGSALGLDEAGLVLRQDLRAVIVHADLLGDRLCGAFAVAGEHDRAPDAEGAQRSHDRAGLLAQRIGDADHGRELAADGEVQVRIRRVEGFKALLFALGDGAGLVLKDEMRRADDDLFAVHRARNAVRDDVLHLGVHFLVRQTAVLRGADDGVRHRVREVLLEAGSDAQHFVRLAAAERDDVRNDRAGVGQRAGLVKDDGVRLGQRLEELAALDGDMIGARLAHRGQDCERHGELERAGEVDHEHGQRAGDVARERVAQHAAGERVGDQLVRQMGRAALRGALELLGLLDHGNDLVVAAFTGLLRDLDHAVALFDDRAGKDLRAGALDDRNRLAGERSLVDSNLAGNDLAVERDHAARSDNDVVAGGDLRQRDRDLGAVLLEPYAAHAERHGAREVVDRLLVRPFLEQLTELEQEHDRTGGAEVAARHGYADGQGVEHLDAQLTAQQAAQAAAQERSRHADRADDLERRGQEQRAGSLDGDHGHELFLIFAVERAAAVLRRERGNGRGAVVKAADGVQQLCTGAGVAHGRAAGALVDGGGLDARLIEQVGFEQVGLLERHAVLVHPDTQPAAALVLNECFHDELPPFNQGKMEKEGHFVPLFDYFGADYASAGAASAAISSAISSAQSSISSAAASASAARCSLMSFAACRMSSAFSRTVSTVFITQSFMRRTAAAAWV